MTDPHYRLPNEVATQLRISPSTLRRWSSEFADYLSGTAGKHDDDLAATSHRRYTSRDVEVLLTIKGLLSEGLTYSQVVRRMESLRLRETIGEIMEEDGDIPVTALGPSYQDSSFAPAVTILADTLHTVSDSQQLLLGSQQANRELLTVVLQDNFNLKEENVKLRDRMLELERDLVEMRRIEDQRRARIEARLRQMEGRFSKPNSQDQQENRPGCLGQFFSPIP